MKAGFAGLHVEFCYVICTERRDLLLNSFLIPIGRAAGDSLATVFAALSCGAALPVADLDILHISDREADPVLPALSADLNLIHELFRETGSTPVFPSSFRFESCRPELPTIQSLSADPASDALLSAVRGKGVPLSYKTDREAVEWAFSVLLSGDQPEELKPFRSFVQRFLCALDGGKPVRAALVCDLCDPFSAGAAFALLRYLRDIAGLHAESIVLFCMARRSSPVSALEEETLAGSLRAMEERSMLRRPNDPPEASADAAWLLSLPASMVRSEDSWRLLSAVLAVQIGRVFSAAEPPAPGLHTVNCPGILTFESLGAQAKPFAAFLHASVWLLSDLLPALNAFFEHPGALKSLAPNTRNGLFRRLFRSGSSLQPKPDELPQLSRALRAVLSEVLSLIRFLPDQIRLAEISDPLWQQVVDACGRTVTVSSEYDVSFAETEEAGIMEVKPVHRVSMADTEEEKQQRRLEDIAAQLQEETAARDALFRSVGGSRAFLALKDCRDRCTAALERAREQESSLSLDPSSDRLSLAAASRRVRLLTAAVSRCEKDLADHELFSGLAAAPAETPSASAPFAGQLLNAPAAEKAAALLTAPEDTAEPIRKELRGMLPSLFYGYTLSDVKTLFRELLSCCRETGALPPLVSLFTSVFTVSREEVASLRFLSAGNTPPFPLLPDLYPEKPPLTIAPLLPLLPVSAGSSDPAGVRRGLLALLLLRQYRRRTSDEPGLLMSRYDKTASPVLRSWLTARKADQVWIISLGSEIVSLPFALILPGRDLIPAHFSQAHVSMLPAFAKPWFDESVPVFRNPCPLLSEGGRTVLLEQLARMAESFPESASPGLRAFLSAFREDLMKRGTPPLPDRLSLRLKAAFGLRLLPAFSSTLVRVTSYYEHFLSTDDIASRLLGLPSFPASACDVPDDILYLYREVPFAREDSRTLLAGIPLPAEDWILNLLEEECRTLARASDDYHEALVRELSLLLERYPDVLPEARRTALEILEKAGEPVSDTVTDLSWPWDPKSPSVLTILTESLGGALAEQALQPFPDLLAVFPARGNDVIGDSLLSSMCLLPPVAAPAAEGAEAPAIQPDAVLPPLSGDFAAALCRLPEGRTLFRQGLFAFERTENSGIKVVLTLEGSFPVRLTRSYAAEEIVNLYSHDIPTLAVWPNLPFAPENWHAYFTYASLPASFRLSVRTADGGSVLSDEGIPRFVSRSGGFPLCFCFFREGRSVGSVPNLLPVPEARTSEPVTACVDFGSVGTSVVLSSGRGRRPLKGPTLVRTLLNNPAVSRDLLRREFLPAVPVSALLPTASRIFRNVPGEAPLPFEDGIVLMTSDLRDVLSIPSGALYTCLKWEEEKGRSIVLCLHQIMLMVALQARSDGAFALSWRFALPDEMAKAGREKLRELFLSLAGQVAEESGFALPDREPEVFFASESSALGGYFRLCAAEDTRGGFMVLDIGACTADISLFLRGREQAVRTCQIPLGVHYMLLPVLLPDPSVLRQDLGYIQDPGFLQDLSLLERILQNAKADFSALRHSRLALDSFIADRCSFLLPTLLYNVTTGMPTRLGSVLLLNLSYLMMLSGLVLLQIAADPGKNDFLPEQMSLCLAGRGSLLIEGMPDQTKAGLWHFLTMFRNRRVASLSLLFSAEKKMEIPVGLSVLQEITPGLPDASAVPAAISVRPEELLPQFLLRFRKEFPASSELLFPGFWTNDFYHPFTPYGESVVSSAIARSFTERTELRPFDSLSAWMSCMLETLTSPAS